jgi:hypothetical protein
VTLSPDRVGVELGGRRGNGGATCDDFQAAPRRCRTPDLPAPRGLVRPAALGDGHDGRGDGGP